jgi:hypothetical protein
MVIHEQDTPEVDVTVYAKRFETLLELAESLNVHPDSAEQLVAEVLLSSLCRRRTTDMDAWLAGAVTYAARRLQ